MVSLADLWIPILVSGVAVFIVSSVLHMALPYHKSDYERMNNEDQVLAAMREQQVAPGEYMFPHADSMQEVQTPEMQEKFKRGPVGLLTVRPNGMWNMGPALAQWFALSVVVSLFAGYGASMGFDNSTSAMDVFRMTFIVAFAAYGLSSVQNSIWKAVRWSVTGKFLFDSVLYSLTTAAIFAWLWPSAA